MCWADDAVPCVSENQFRDQVLGQLQISQALSRAFTKTKPAAQRRRVTKLQNVKLRCSVSIIHNKLLFDFDYIAVCISIVFQTVCHATVMVT